MPRPCAVEAHARSYKTQRKDFCGCHGLAPWRLTLAATKHSGKTFADATALRRGGSRSQLQNTAERLLRMPRPCAAEAHSRSYKTQRKNFADATALRRGGSRSPLQNTAERLWDATTLCRGGSRFRRNLNG